MTERRILKIWIIIENTSPARLRYQCPLKVVARVVSLDDSDLFGAAIGDKDGVLVDSTPIPTLAVINIVEISSRDFPKGSEKNVKLIRSLD